MNWFRLEYPWVLVFIPFLLVLLGVIMFARSRIGFLRVVSFVLRSLIIIALCLILAGFQIKGEGHHLARCYLIDNSGSVFLSKTEVIDTIKEHIRLLQPEDQIGVIVFGRDASIELSLGEKVRLSDWNFFTSQVDPAGTDIEQVLKRAMDLFPAGYRKEIYLFTDGHETQGNAERIIPLLQNQGITLYTVPTGPERFPDIKVDSFRLPQYVSESEPLLGRLVLSSSMDTTGAIYLYQDNKLIRELKDITFFQDKQTTLTIELPPQEKIISVYEARVVTTQFREFCQENNLGQVIVQKIGKPGILYLTNAPKDNILGLILKEIDEFRTDIFTVDQFDTIELASLLAGYQVIVLNNLSIDAVTRDGLKPEILDTLKEFIHERGKGLVILGGKSSFGLGGYQETILEELSPVWAKPKDTIGLVIILDASGSMAEPVVEDKIKFQIACEALEETLGLLDKGDKLEVIIFNQDFNVIYPLQSVKKLNELDERLNKIKPTGSTAILKPIKNRALDILTGLEVTKKHIILISDGESTVGETNEDAGRLGKLSAQDKISISTIATGVKINEPFLKALSSDQTNGRFYHLEDIQELKRFLKEDLSYYKGLYREAEDLRPEIKYREDILKDIEQLPSLKGYCRTTLKDRGRLIASLEENEEPLLASWQYGRGRVVAFTSAFKPADLPAPSRRDPFPSVGNGKAGEAGWSASWLEWSQLGQFITQLLRWTVPAGLATELNIRVTTQLKDANNLQIKVTVPRVSDQLNLKVCLKSLKLPFATVVESTIPQIAPRNYEVVIPNLQQGSYLLDIIPACSARLPARQADRSEAKQAMRLNLIPVTVSYATEWRHFGPDRSSLASWAETTGGKLLLDLDEKITESRLPEKYRGNKIYQRIDSFLIICVLVFLLIDLAVTRPFSYV